MHIPPIPDSETHLYRHIAQFIIKQVDSGELPAGYQLPTVRQLASDNEISQGTAKHAYDFLESMGYIQKTQGRGTFVSQSAGPASTSKKQDALRAIDNLLDISQELGFSHEEIRVFFDLKLREREQKALNVRLGAIDCCPEALATMGSQISEFPYVDVYEFLLDTITKSEVLTGASLDLIVTTPTHSDALEDKIPPDIPTLRLVMSMTSKTLLELSRIPSDSNVGILCKSRRFSQIITEACYAYGVLSAPPAVALFGNEAETFKLLNQADRVIIPQNYRRFASPRELEQIHSRSGEKAPVLFGYQVEKGSLVFLEEQIKGIFNKKQHN